LFEKSLIERGSFFAPVNRAAFILFNFVVMQEFETSLWRQKYMQAFGLANRT